MKKLLIITLLITAFVACKKEAVVQPATQTPAPLIKTPVDTTKKDTAKKDTSTYKWGTIKLFPKGVFVVYLYDSVKLVLQDTLIFDTIAYKFTNFRKTVVGTYKYDEVRLKISEYNPLYNDEYKIYGLFLGGVSTPAFSTTRKNINLSFLRI